MATYTQDIPINYREVYFTRVALRKINGNPAYNDIQHFYKQIEANATSVPSTLGGGQHGHASPPTPRLMRALHPPHVLDQGASEIKFFTLESHED